MAIAKKHMLKGQQRHLVQRFSYGITPQLAADVRRAGGAAKWFERQLVAPATFPDAKARRTRTWWPDLERGPADLWQRQVQEVRGGWEVMHDYGRWLLVRRIATRRPVLEKMTEFWEAMLHVPVSGDPAFTWRVRYGDTVRKHALGRFDALLAATVTHPAMLIHLDAATSTKAAPNENLGRELLELFTLGEGNFTEDDVKSSARILTGHHVDVWQSWGSSYRPADHWTGRVRVRDFTHANTKADGREVTKAYLRHLAHHPDTAYQVCRRLAAKFVRQNPSPALVRRLAKVYLAHDTAIRPVLRALVGSKEFRAAHGAKTRDPSEHVVATYRAVRARPARPTGSKSAAHAILWQADALGLSPHAWPLPDGSPVTDEVWASPAFALAAFDVHWAMAGRWWPSEQIAYRKPAAWIPAKGITFRRLVENLSRDVLHRSATDRLLQTCVRATGIRPGQRIDRKHPLYTWAWPRLMAAVLDSPEHFTC